MIIDKDLIIKAKEKLGEKAAFIISEDLAFENFDEKNLKACCHWHNEDTPSLIWNIKNNCYHCFGACGINYGIIDHYMDFYNLTYLQSVQKLFELVEIEYKFGEMGVQQKRNYKYPNRIEFENRNKVDKYLTLRKISQKTLDYCDIQEDDSENIVFHYYNENDVLMLVKYRPAKKLAKKDIKAWCQKDADTSPLLFNMNRIDPTKPLVICEGEIDCLSVIEAGYKNCVSIPFGAQNETWIENCWEWLEQFEKIIVWADNDIAGIHMRKNVCARLGSWRTYYVDIPPEIDGIKVKDANEILYYFGSQSIIDFIDNANEIPIADIIDLSEVNDYDIENAQGLYTGINQLDKYLYKIVFGTVSIWTGVNSSGKSVLVNQIGICEPLNQGYDVFVFSGELPKPMLKSWLERTMAGPECITMKNEHIRVIDKDKLPLIRDWYKRRVWIYDNEKDYSMNSVLNKMEELARKWGVKSFVIDNLMMIDLECAETDKYTKQKEFVLKLVNFANKYNVVVHLVAHPRKIEFGRRINKMDVSGSGDITNLCHYCFGIHRYSDKEKRGQIQGQEETTYDCVTSIFKNRITGTQDKDVDVWFDLPSYRFYSNTIELYKRYKWNKDTSPLPTDNPKDRLPEFMER